LNPRFERSSETIPETSLATAKDTEIIIIAKRRFGRAESIVANIAFAGQLIASTSKASRAWIITGNSTTTYARLPAIFDRPAPSRPIFFPNVSAPNHSRRFVIIFLMIFAMKSPIINVIDAARIFGRYHTIVEFTS
jgi:hypothetical protein